MQIMVSTVMAVGMSMQKFLYIIIIGANNNSVYRDHAGWSASLPYIQKNAVSVAIYTLHKRVPMVKYGDAEVYLGMSHHRIVFVFARPIRLR